MPSGNHVSPNPTGIWTQPTHDLPFALCFPQLLTMSPLCHVAWVHKPRVNISNHVTQLLIIKEGQSLFSQAVVTKTWEFSAEKNNNKKQTSFSGLLKFHGCGTRWHLGYFSGEKKSHYLWARKRNNDVLCFFQLCLAVVSLRNLKIATMSSALTFLFWILLMTQ